MSEYCNDALENVYVYLDKELDELSASAIRSHLEDCPPCGDAFAFEDRLKTVVRERLKVDVPREFIDRLRTALRDERT